MALGATRSPPRYVALKIMIANATSETELSILEHLAGKAGDDGDARHVTVLLDEFQHEGPNGIQQCFVFELMGATATSLLEALPKNNPKAYGLPGNILFSIKGIDAVGEEELRQDEATTKVPVQRVDGKKDRWAPGCLYVAQSLHEHVKLDEELKVKISDLGSSFHTASPPLDTATPLALRAPELILRQSFGLGIDICALGCLMFEFFTGRTLRVVMKLRHDQQEQDDADDDHLVKINDVIRPLPDSIMESWPRASKWYGPNKEPLKQESEDEPFIHDPIEKLFVDNKHPQISEDEAATLVHLIRRILDYDPAKRPSAEELLEHP